MGVKWNLIVVLFVFPWWLMILSIFFMCFLAICTSLEKCLFKIFFFSHLKIGLFGGGELPWWISSKESGCQAGDAGSIPGSAMSLGRKWLPTPVFLPGKFHRQRNVVGSSPWGRKRVRHDLATNTFTFFFFIMVLWCLILYIYVIYLFMNINIVYSLFLL